MLKEHHNEQVQNKEEKQLKLTFFCQIGDLNISKYLKRDLSRKIPLQGATALNAELKLRTRARV